jgi:hypothetical protein
MKLGAAGSEDRKKAMAVGGFVVVAAGLLYYELGGSGGGAPAPPAAPVVVTVPAAGVAAGGAGSAAAIGAGTAAKTLGASSAALDPTLHMDAMLVSESVEYAGSGRNIFSPNSAPPVVIPKPVAQARPVAPPPVVIPCPPDCPPPPPPPPIDLKFFGIASRNGKRQAFLLHNDDVFLASAGDIVLRRYRVISIEARTIEVEDMQNNNKQTLPLLAN